jgi:hypothetical protein
MKIFKIKFATNLVLQLKAGSKNKIVKEKASSF